MTHVETPKPLTSFKRIDMFSVSTVLMVVAMAFNDLYPVLPVGELSKEGFIYVFPPLFVLYFLLKAPGTLSLPTPLLLMTLGLLMAILLGVALNYNDIVSASFKGRSGIERVFTQGLSVALGLSIILLSYNLTIDGKSTLFSRGARVALLIMGFVGFFEFASWFGIPGLSQAHEVLSLIIHENPSYAQRLRTTAFEVSWTAVMLTFLFPFAIADTTLSPGKVVAYILLVVALVVLAQSRTALLVIGIQGMILAWTYLRRRFDVLLCIVAAAYVAGIMIFVFGLGDPLLERVNNLIEYGSFSGNTQATEENVSNVTRIASIKAGLSMFQERPLFGVGLGQYGFEYPGHILAEDLRSWEVRNYVDGSDPVWPPTYSIHVRLLAETGLTGYLIWFSFVVPILLGALIRANTFTGSGRIYLAVAMTLAGWLMLGFSIDSFRFFGGWIAVGVAFGLPSACRQTRQ